VLILRKGEVAAYDSIDRLRELMRQPSLEGVFAQLAQVDAGEEVAGRILGAMGSGEAVSVPAAPVAAGRRRYRGIANAFPQEFQNAYGPELLQTGEDAVLHHYVGAGDAHRLRQRGKHDAGAGGGAAQRDRARIVRQLLTGSMLLAAGAKLGSD
jgi:hypothetical protein